MQSSEIKKKFLDFFERRGHKIVPSSSLIPDDPSVLLTTAGMQQFKPYFLGKADPARDFGARRAASIQKCFRTSDIDEVGDESHMTFFEMLGHFSFGDPEKSDGIGAGYFKKETIEWTYELLTKVFGISPDRISATVFAGDDKIPFDQESYDAWSGVLPRERIRKGQRADNVWGPPGGPGTEGPCGAANEVYVDDLEIATLVFMEYYCSSRLTQGEAGTKDGGLTLLPAKGVDIGWGFERAAKIVQNAKTIFDIDSLKPYLELLPQELSIRVKRIIIDHIRASAFLIADGVRPSNKEAGYILRRLLRRIFVYEYQNKLPTHVLDSILHDICHDYGEFYPELLGQADEIRREIRTECEKFLKTIERGLEKLGTVEKVDGAIAFMFYESYGLPYEIIKELAGRKAENLTRAGFDEEFKKHQEASRTGAEKKFGGHGLILNTGELKAANEEELKKVTRLHTATHLLQAALRKILGGSVKQAGSDITAERTRFDFTLDRKLTSEELKMVEDLVNFVVDQKYEVKMEEMVYEDAMQLGALHFFKEKYPAIVKVYSVGDFTSDLPEVFSRELCGGPHVKNTSEVGNFKILKQEPLGSGLRRIRATVY